MQIMYCLRNTRTLGSKSSALMLGFTGFLLDSEVLLEIPRKGSDALWITEEKTRYFYASVLYLRAYKLSQELLMKFSWSDYTPSQSYT